MGSREWYEQAADTLYILTGKTMYDVREPTQEELMACPCCWAERIEEELRDRPI